MRKIRVKFVDQCWDQQDKANYLYPLLAKHYDVELVEKDPEYLFCSVFGRAHLKYDCVKIFFSGENLAPDFNWYDYAIGGDWITFGDRYLRVPLYAFYGAYKRLVGVGEGVGEVSGSGRESIEGESSGSGRELVGRKFCSFVVSNANADPIRDRFFARLSKYKPVDSGGRHLNNVGGPVPDKLAFCAQYKFNIAFENSSYPGYTTEKIMEPLSVKSVPIYWGNPEIEREFSPACMVRVKDESDIERAVEEIIRLDRDDAAYLAKCRAPALVQSESYEARLEAFLCHIIDQPIDQAKRLAGTGTQRIYRSYQRHALGVYDSLRKLLPPWK